jgi:phosphoglycolate phosphatase-like HAD superfamily hydrolase
MEHSTRRPRKLAIRAARAILPVLAQTGGSSVQWQNAPKTWKQSGTSLIEEVPASTDYWRHLVAALDLLGIADSFEVIVDLSDVSEPKPSPEIYLTAVSRHALAPSKCMVVEDALTGVLSAKRAGCVVSALTRTFKSEALLEVGADFTFESFAKLQCFLENDLRNQAKPSL